MLGVPAMTQHDTGCTGMSVVESFLCRVPWPQTGQHDKAEGLQ